MARPRTYTIKPEYTLERINQLRAEGMSWYAIGKLAGVPSWSIRRWHQHRTDPEFRERMRASWRESQKRWYRRSGPAPRQFPLPTLLHLLRKRNTCTLTPAESSLLEFFVKRKRMYETLASYRKLLRELGHSEDSVRVEARKYAEQIMGGPGPYLVPEWIRQALRTENEPTCPDPSPGPTPPSKTSKTAPSSSTTPA